MKLGALIITTGLSKVSSVAALLSEVGTITAGQRIISAFPCARVALVGLVVGPEDKKSEQQLSRPIVEVTLHNDFALYDTRLSTLLHLVEDTPFRPGCLLSDADVLLRRLEFAQPVGR